jgi:hypothetical protein
MISNSISLHFQKVNGPKIKRALETAIFEERREMEVNLALILFRRVGIFLNS